MRILLATDAFPPVCGGSGWSTYELARGLRQAGHEVGVVQVVGERPRRDGETYDGFRIRIVGIGAPAVPFVRNYWRNERLWRRAAAGIGRAAAAHGAEIIHAQHVFSSPAAVEAAAAARVPAVCTVRDYWPVCYWGTLILDPASTGLCPGCSARMMTACLRPRAGAAWPATLPAVPYMRANLARKQRALARADAIVAVGSVIARDLRERAPLVAGGRLEVIPNPVNVSALRREAGAAPLKGPYAVFVGKLEANKGADALLPAVERARLPWPLAVVGDGALRPRLEAEARRLSRDARFLGWVERERAMAWLSHASLLVFPSRGPESLSRVLLEAAAVGVPIAAMNTGGTGDIVRHGVTGLLSETPEGLGDDVARLVSDRGLAADLARRAREHVESRFDTPVVVERLLALYRDLIDRRRRDG
ncbi:MAG TPA: glycosyltransferase family 4 protein [Vicinamibacterales bacterium]|nr:glycosyltransferase family 4 protein [Vicinamibacterales bacterium]HPW19908.1 glycosyltransferase family 4 protein [Vicinamibacterales bacterium]